MDLATLRDFFVVLVHPKHPGNVGAVARAMGNMGLFDLRLVEEPGRRLAHEGEAIARSCDSHDILETSRSFATLPEALADSVFAVGTSARPRDHVIPQPPREITQMLAARRELGKIGIVFGREDDGLSVDELARCHALIRIPTHPVRSSLNLSHAVQVVLYELMMAAAQPTAGGLPRPASQQNRDALFTHAERALRSLGAFPQGMIGRKLRYLRQVLDRAQPSDPEVYFLHGMFRQVEWVMGRWFGGLPVPPNFQGCHPDEAQRQMGDTPHIPEAGPDASEPE